MAQLPAMLTTAEVAELFRVNVATVRRWVEAGQLKAVVLPSKRLRFSREDIEARLAGRAA
jgi:excisionase family DNA binding protein